MLDEARYRPHPGSRRDPMRIGIVGGVERGWTTYEQLAEAVWAVTTGPESNSLEVHVSRIRQKLEAGGESRLIQTVRGIGYRFIAESRQEVST